MKTAKTRKTIADEAMATASRMNDMDLAHIGMFPISFSFPGLEQHCRPPHTFGRAIRESLDDPRYHRIAEALVRSTQAPTPRNIAEQVIAIIGLSIIISTIAPPSDNEKTPSNNPETDPPTEGA